MVRLQISEVNQIPWPSTHHGYHYVRWIPDVPPETGVEELLRTADECMKLCGPSYISYDRENEYLEILVCQERFSAPVHQATALWLCANLLTEQCEVHLNQPGTVLLSPVLASPEQFPEEDSLLELTAWWISQNPMPISVSREHQVKLRTILKRRQYSSMGGYVSRALRGEADPGRTCFAFVPLIVTAVWGQHAEISLNDMTQGLDLKDMARRPQQALLSWLNTLQIRLKQLPAGLDAEPIERVISSIRTNCALPFSQQSISRSLGLTPAYFCRLFREKTGQHFSTFLTAIRMEHAQELLRADPAVSLQTVSEACGYPNRNYFTQVFRRYTGLTPAEFIQRTAGDPK